MRSPSAWCALVWVLLLMVALDGGGVHSAAQRSVFERRLAAIVRTPHENQQAQCAFCNPSGPRSCPSGCRFDRNSNVCVPAPNCRQCRCK